MSGLDRGVLKVHTFAVQLGGHSLDCIWGGVGFVKCELEDSEVEKIDATQLRGPVGREESQGAVLFAALAIVALDHKIVVPGYPRLRTHLGQRNFEVREVESTGFTLDVPRIADIIVAKCL